MSPEAASLVDLILAQDPVQLGVVETTDIDVSPSDIEGERVVQPAEATLARAEAALHTDQDPAGTYLFDTLV